LPNQKSVLENRGKSQLLRTTKRRQGTVDGVGKEKKITKGIVHRDERKWPNQEWYQTT